MKMIAEWYWSLANAITAFFVAQMVVFQFSLADQSRLEGFRRTPRIVMSGLLLAIVVYAVAVLLCHCAYIMASAPSTPRETHKEALAMWTMIGRILAILLYGGGISALFYYVAFVIPRRGAPR